MLNVFPTQSLFLLNHFIWLHPVNAYQALQTPLFSSLLARLAAISPAIKAADPSEDLVWISALLTTLSMLLPRIPTSLEKYLDQLFLIFARCLLWHSTFTQSTPINRSPGELEENQDVPLADPEPPQTSTPFASLMDYFTSLYGLFPANVLYFLTSPLRWLQSHARRQIKRRRALTASSTASGPAESLHPPGGRSKAAPALSGHGGEDNSTSGDEAFPLPGESATETAARVAAAARKKSKSRPHGKGRRSKIQKQKKDAVSRARKEKDTLKQKEREKRRKSVGLASGPESSQLASDTGLPMQRSASSSESEIGQPGIEVDVPEGKERKESRTAHDSTSEQSDDGVRADYEAEVSSSSSPVGEDEVTDQDMAVELDDALVHTDWSYVRRLAEVGSLHCKVQLKGVCLKRPFSPASRISFSIH